MARSNNRQKPGKAASKRAVVTYTNRRGDVYYLHEGRTKTGKARYFAAKAPRAGALSAMPDGFEFCESINGVVSVRKIDSKAPSVPEGDVNLARAEMARHAHLRRHRIEVVKGEIVIFEPISGLFPDLEAEIARHSSMRPEIAALLSGSMRQRIRYGPVMKFVPVGDKRYSVHRMTYRGDGGWSWPLASGRLQELLERFLGRVGTDQFFELL